MFIVRGRNGSWLGLFVGRSWFVVRRGVRCSAKPNREVVCPASLFVWPFGEAEPHDEPEVHRVVRGAWGCPGCMGAKPPTRPNRPPHDRTSRTSNHFAPRTTNYSCEAELGIQRRSCYSLFVVRPRRTSFASPILRQTSIPNKNNELK